MSYLARLHIGNDVVMLTTANHSHWIGNSRKMDKVFTAEEQQQIEEAGQPPAMSWVLWSMKECLQNFQPKNGRADICAQQIYSPNYQNQLFERFMSKAGFSFLRKQVAGESKYARLHGIYPNVSGRRIPAHHSLRRYSAVG